MNLAINELLQRINELVTKPNLVLDEAKTLKLLVESLLLLENQPILDTQVSPKVSIINLDQAWENYQ